MAPGRYFDNQDGPGGDRPRGNNEWRGGGDRGGSRGRGGGRGRGAPREGGRGGFGGDRGGRGGGGRGRGDGGRGRGAPRGRGNGRDGGRDRDDRPPKESFKAKEGFIAGGLKAYADTAAEAKLKKASGADDDAAGHQTTLYLTNLPASLTSPQLTLMFSSYAPVRAAFVVSSSRSSEPEAPAFGGANTISLAAGRDRTGKSTSRGFGYVRFVLRADAEQCLAEWGATAGFPHSVVNELRGQEGLQNVEWEKLTGAGGMKMSWAKKKLKDGEKPEGASADWKEKKPKGEKKEKKPVVLTEGDEIAAVDAADAPKWRPGVWDHNAPRTVIVFGLPLPGEAGSTEEEEEDESKEDESKEDESKKESEEKQVQEQEGEEKMAVDGEEGAAESAVPEAGPSKPKGKPIDWKKALKQRAKKLGDVEDVNYPYQLPTGEIAAMILMYTPKEAHAVQSKLNNHVFRGVLVSAAIKSSWDLCQKLGRQKGGGRLLVRNLGFDITIPDLRAAFARFGSLHSVTLPIDPKTNKPRGFAFIYYVGKPMAEAALKGVNGTRIYSGMAAERIASEGGKEGKKKEVREKKKAEKAQFQGGGGEKGRVVAVDWALSKEEWEKAQEEAKAAASASGSDSGSDSDSEEDSDEEDEDSDMTPVPEGDESEEEDDDSDTDPIPVGLDNDGQNEEKDSEDEESEDEKPKQEGTTLFVRNMSFEATEAELYDLFKSFGPVRYARIVYDPTTKRSRGTAFVCFWNEEHAWEVLRASRALNEGNFGETSNKRGNQSLLMADPSGSTASRLTLHGRVLAAVLAVSKGDADKLREDRDKKGAAKTDRRNLYLMREGVIFPSWAIAKTLSSADMDARQSSYDARKGLLRSNPSLYISRTRLSIRQIPLYVSDGMLKRLANHAIKEFERDTKGGFQKPLTDDEKLGFVADASGAKESSMKVERRKGIPLARVRQSKILRQNDRVDPVTGLGRSKGYGFLELGSHADALRVVRWANANKEVNRLFRGWWREALEKMIEDVENGEGKMGKGVKAKDKEDRLSRLREKQKELAEEEKLAEEKAAKREAAGKSTTGEDGRSSKCLIIEFSIENAVTTKRRAEKVDRAREKSKRAKERAENGEGSDESDDSDDEADAPQKGRNDKKGGPKRDLRGGPAVAGKKRRNDDDEAASPNKKRTKAAAVPEAEKTEGQRVGSMIGRKRKMKKGGK